MSSWQMTHNRCQCSYKFNFPLLSSLLLSFLETTHHLVVVDQLVDPAQLEDNESPNDFHRCLRLESRIVVLEVAEVKQL